jgi:hypothetical protein
MAAANYYWLTSKIHIQLVLLVAGYLRDVGRDMPTKINMGLNVTSPTAARD